MFCRMLQEVYKAAGSGAVVGALLESKLKLFRSPSAYAAYHAKAASGKPAGELYSQLVAANRLVSPSYVSYETALYWYELLPAGCGRVIRSACASGRSRSLPYGGEEYAYTCQPKKYFAVGWVELPQQEPLYSIATPEKALCDLVLDTPRLSLHTRTAVYNYLLHTLRVPEEKLCRLAPELIEVCAAAACKKRKDLEMLATFLYEVTPPPPGR